VLEHREKLTGSGEIAARRREQQIKWMWTMFDDTLRTRLRSDSVLKDRLPQIEADVADGRLSPTLAIEEITRTLGLSS
jgi:LAO/AO transport system kinase